MTYKYDAFGNVTTATGTKTTPYRYSGYQFDDETGLYYLNARYYNPVIARFMSADTYYGRLSDPLSLNLYTYCHNEPIMYWNPTGHFDFNFDFNFDFSGISDINIPDLSDLNIPDFSDFPDLSGLPDFTKITDDINKIGEDLAKIGEDLENLKAGNTTTPQISNIIEQFEQFGLLELISGWDMSRLDNLDLSALTAITNNLQANLKFDFGMDDFFNSAEWINLMNSDFSISLNTPKINLDMSGFNNAMSQLNNTIQKGTQYWNSAGNAGQTASKLAGGFNSSYSNGFNVYSNVKATPSACDYLDAFQTTLDLAGLIPGVGEIADGANAGIYALRGDTLNAGLSALAAIPFAGWAATGGKFINKGAKAIDAIDDVYDVAKTIDRTDDVYDAARGAGNAASGFYHSANPNVVEIIQQNGFRTDLPNPQAAFHNNRFGSGVYLADSPATALAERPGGAILEINADIGKNLDVTNRGILDYDMGQAVARGAQKHGFDSITFNSAQIAGGKNIVIFDPTRVTAK